MYISTENLKNSFIIEGCQILGGSVLFVVFGAAAIVALEHCNDISSRHLLFTFAAIAAGGFVILTLGIKRVMLVKELKNYIPIIGNNTCLSIEEIATASGQSADTVKTNLQNMIKKEFFYNAKISPDGKYLILNTISSYAASISDYDEAFEDVTDAIDEDTSDELEEIDEFDEDADSNLETDVPPMSYTRRVLIKCVNCGAINTISEGQIIECEYCGSLLQK